MVQLLLALGLAACSSPSGTSAKPTDSAAEGADSDTDQGDGGEGGTDTTVPAGPRLGTPVPITDSGGNAGADLAIDADGRLYAVWARGGSVLLATSSDAGASWTSPMTVHEGALEVAAHDVSHPQVIVDGGRLVVSLAPQQHQYLYIGDSETLTFAPAVFVGDPDLKFEDLFIRSAIAPDGEVWTSFHAFPAGNGWSNGWKGIARESTGWALERASDAAPGLPCECCPQDLAFTEGGEPVLGYRNNDDDIRDMFVATGHEFATSTQVGHTDWAITYCPVQGPRLARLADGSLLMVWSDASLGDASVLAAASADGGTTWSTPVDALSNDGVDHKSPTVAAGGAGEVWLTSCTSYDGQGGVAHSDDQGQTWSARSPLQTPGGALLFPEVAASASLAGTIGVDDAGRVWYVEVAAPME